MERTICVWGDSITYGAYDKEKHGWVNRFSLSSDNEIYNLGVSGDTTSDVLKRFSVEAEARKPEIIVFAIGVNDTLFRKTGVLKTETEPDLFRENIEKLISLARKYTNKIIFIGLSKVQESKVQPLPWSKSGKCYANKEIDIFDGIIKIVCDREKTEYLHIFDLLSSEDLEDGIHPNSEGHRKIFEVVKEKLGSLVWL